MVINKNTSKHILQTNAEEALQIWTGQKLGVQHKV